MLNPGSIIIGGAYALGGDLVLNMMKRAARKYTLATLYSAVRWEVSSLGINPAAAGAAALIFDQYFGNRLIL